MDQFLYGIPLIGLVFELVGYLIAITPAIAPIVLGAATPIAFAALCGVMCERSGVVNIGIEGTMLVAAFVGWTAGIYLTPVLGSDPGPFFGASPALVAALMCALLSALVVSLVHAWLSISVKADQIISGTIINIAALGLTGYLNRIFITPNPRLGAGTFQTWRPPEFLTDLPVVGWLFNMFLKQGPIAMSLIVFVIVLQVLLFRSRWGLRTRAVGEHPRAADTLGINVLALRYRNVIVGGIFAGLAGAFLTLEQTGSFQTGMTAGRGFIALACVIFGRWTPIGAFGAALLFAGADAFGRTVGLIPPTGELSGLGDVLGAVPDQFYGVLPYVVTIIVLAGAVGRSVPPAAVGRPYVKEGQET